ncbi:30S ribosomal protein S27ae [Candidatus Woesearchaeota archaeon]|nr:30S ribosomal protein S27ae [Candidatus Woesearchaeota archaeon]
MADDKKGAAKKPAGPVKKGKAYKISKVYEVSGGHVSKKNKTCPKCGPGTFMANHKDRWTCGKCKYSEKK